MATLKQRTAFEKTVENRRKGNPKTMGQILLDSGYSRAMAIKPTEVTRSKGWHELLNEVFPDERLAIVHSELLDSNDQRVKKEALHMAYQLKDKYPEAKSVTKIEAIRNERSEYFTN